MSLPRSNRRGFTLIELLVALILLVIVGTGLYGTLITVQRVSTKQAEVSNLQGNLRTGMQLVQSELEELFSNAGTGISDIQSPLSSTLIHYHAMRGIGETCLVTNTGVTIQAGSWNGPVPKAGQHLLLLLDNDSTLASDDSWLELTPSAGLSLAVLCPDASAAYLVPVTLTTAQSTGIYPPSPVRTLDDMEMGLVASGGQNWLGIRSITAGEPALVPVIGPLTGSGVEFEFRDASNSVTATPANVKTILVTLRGITDRTVATGLGSTLGNPTDSLQVRIQLRNSR